uniref:G-2 and S-phase expressed 1 n=1 Tax=Lates calcarifer TaxID=8187 RepID=A0A4W6FI05_LATCA
MTSGAADLNCSCVFSCRTLNAEQKRRFVSFHRNLRSDPDQSVSPQRRTNGGMDCRANSDLFFLPDEKFDFDVSLSPASSTGDADEDEVFIGPVCHKERCISVNVASRLEDGGGGVRVSWSPLTGDQLEAVCQEAHRLATQLQTRDDEDGDETTAMITDTTAPREEFVQDAEAKLGVLGQTASALSPIKRQTFCVQDSPMKQLPPAIQRRLLRQSNTKSAASTRPTAAATNNSRASSTRLSSAASSTRPSTRLSTSSPVAGVKAQPRTSLRGKAALGVGIVLPSKPAAPPASCSTSKSRVEKTRLQPPSKVVGGWRRSPTSRPSSRAESCEDLLSDSTSVASDISDCSLNSSLPGKRMLAPPTKSVARNSSGVKAPPLQSRRKNTSSSSSSVSSFNSSMSLSPAKGKPNSSLNRSLSGSTGPAPSSVSSRPANHSRPRRSTVYTAAEPTSSSSSTAAAGRRSLSAQTRKPSEAERIKAIRSTPLKRAEATPLQLTPAKRVLERTSSVPPTATVQAAERTESQT